MSESDKKNVFENIAHAVKSENVLHLKLWYESALSLCSVLHAEKLGQMDSITLFVLWSKMG